MASSSAAPSLLAALLTDLPPPEAGAAAWPEERWRQVLEEDARIAIKIHDKVNKKTSWVYDATVEAVMAALAVMAGWFRTNGSVVEVTNERTRLTPSIVLALRFVLGETSTRKVNKNQPANGEKWRKLLMELHEKLTSLDGAALRRQAMARLAVPIRGTNATKVRLIELVDTMVDSVEPLGAIHVTLCLTLHPSSRPPHPVGAYPSLGHPARLRAGWAPSALLSLTCSQFCKRGRSAPGPTSTTRRSTPRRATCSPWAS